MPFREDVDDVVPLVVLRRVFYELGLEKRFYKLIGLVFDR